MAQLKHIPNNSILGRYFYDNLTPVNSPTYQNRESKHCKFTTETVLMINDGNQGYKFDKSSEIVFKGDWFFAVGVCLLVGAEHLVDL